MRLNVVVCVKAPLVPITVIGNVPSDAPPVAVSVSVEPQLRFGVHEVGEKLAETPAGRPLADKLTEAGAPERSVMFTEFVTEPPCTTERLPPFAIEKSKGVPTVMAFTASVLGQ